MSGPLHTLLSDTAISGQVRQRVSHVAQGMQKRNQRIEALQHSFLLRGCFRRQEKTKAQTGKQVASSRTAERELLTRKSPAAIHHQ